MGLLKSLKKDMVVAAVIYILVGLVLIFFPETTARTIGYTFACVLLLLGLRCIFNYMMRDVQLTFYYNDLVGAALFIISSVAVFIHVEAVVSFIPFILGVFVTISGVLKLQNAMNLKRLNTGGSITVLLLAVLNTLFGIVLILNPFNAMATLVRIIGIGLLFSGITDFITTILIAKKIRVYMDANGVIKGEVLEKESE